jgi:hypothetical protein
MATGAWLDDLNRHLERPILCKCSHCSFEIRAPLEQAHKAFEQHVCGRPKVTVSKRRRSGLAAPRPN